MPSSDSNDDKQRSRSDRESKRTRKDKSPRSRGGGSEKSGSKDDGNIAAMLAKLRVDLRADLKDDIKVSASETKNYFRKEFAATNERITNLENAQTSNDGRLNDFEQKLLEGSAKVNKLIESTKETEKRCASSAEAAAAAAAQASTSAAATPLLAHPVPTPKSSSSANPSFDRAPLDSVIQCNTEGGVMFTKEATKCFFLERLKEKGLVCEFEIPGQYQTSKRFRVVFKGPGNVPNEIVASLLRSRRTDDNKWIEFVIKNPSGDSVRFYFGPDKSPKQEKLEAVTNRFCKVLRSKYGEDKFFARKEAGRITSDGSPLAQISVTETSSELQWFKRTIERPIFSFLDKDEMLGKFQELFSEELCS